MRQLPIGGQGQGPGGDRVSAEQPRLHVIGAGFGRTGTTSLCRALERLGYDPCYQMQVTLKRYTDMRFWVRAKAGEPVDYRRFFRRYRATVDWPSCEFYRELMAAFPDARVILTLRDPEAWYESMLHTLWPIQSAFPWWFPRVVRRMHDDLIWNGRFDGAFTDRARAIAIYRAHVEEVRRSVPAERLLLFDVRDGWQPLCEFLGKPVPVGEPFPHLNDRKYFRRVMLALRIAGWAVPAVVGAGVVWVTWWVG
jgi:hypothetical protein